MSAIVAPGPAAAGQTIPRSATAARRANNFGALRLLFAVLVVLSHSFSLADGERVGEPLSRFCGTISFGVLGVDGFFLISGYLIVKSAVESQTALTFLWKRLLRIYPGYIVAYLACIAISPLVGGDAAALRAGETVASIVFLYPPEVAGAFAGTPHPMLNGSMWTIAYEFRCYLLVLALWSIGLLERRLLLLVATGGAAMLAAAHADIWGWFPPRLLPLLGSPDLGLTFVAIFGCGALFYLYLDRIGYDGRLAALAAAALTLTLFFPQLAEAGLVLFGGYLLFWFTFKVKLPLLARIGSHTDLSYGVYLYAWPVQKLLVWVAPEASPWLIFAEASVIAVLLGYVSWQLIERPSLGLIIALPAMRVAAKARLACAIGGGRRAISCYWDRSSSPSPPVMPPLQ